MYGKYYNKELAETTSEAIEKASDEYLDGLFEYNYLPERVGELLEEKYGIGNVAIKELWVDVDGATETEIVSEMMEFCLSHKIKSYTVEFDDLHEIVYAVCLIEKGNNNE